MYARKHKIAPGKLAPQPSNDHDRPGRMKPFPGEKTFQRRAGEGARRHEGVLLLRYPTHRTPPNALDKRRAPYNESPCFCPRKAAWQGSGPEVLFQVASALGCVKARVLCLFCRDAPHAVPAP